MTRQHRTLSNVSSFVTWMSMLAHTLVSTYVLSASAYCVRAANFWKEKISLLGQLCKWTLFHSMDQHRNKKLRKMLSMYFGQAQRDTFMVSRCISLLFLSLSENDLFFCFNKTTLCQDLTHTDFRIFHFLRYTCKNIYLILNWLHVPWYDFLFL